MTTEIYKKDVYENCNFKKIIIRFEYICVINANFSICNENEAQFRHEDLDYDYRNFHHRNAFFPIVIAF